MMRKFLASSTLYSVLEVFFTYGTLILTFLHYITLQVLGLDAISFAFNFKQWLKC